LPGTIFFRMTRNSGVAQGQLIAKQIGMDVLSRALSQATGRQVLDQIGLHGVYDFTLEWAAKPDDAGAPGPGPSGAPSPAVAALISAAVSQQLGLELNEQTGPVEIFVVDKAE